MIKEINTVKFIYKDELETDEIDRTKIQDYWKKIRKEKDYLCESNILIVSNFIKDNNNYIIELKGTTFSNYMYVKNQKARDIKCLFSGAYILTKDQYIVFVMNRYYENELEFETLNLVGGIADVKDLGIVPFNIIPHFMEEKRKQWTKDFFRDVLQDNPFTVYAITDKQAVAYIDGKIQFVGGKPEIFEKNI